jgi:hypothetical protein
MTTVSTERELFEAWAVTESFNIDRHYDDAGGEYHRVTTRWAWMAWQAARSADTSGAPDQVIELAEALQVRHILEEIKKVVAIHPAAEMPTPFQAAWQSCCEEIFYRATGCQWHMDEDATRFGREAAPLPEPPPAAPVGARSGEANAEVT